MWTGEEKISHLSNKTKIKWSKANLLAPKISNSIKQCGKPEIKNIMKNKYAAFLQYEILKWQSHTNVDE